MNRKPLVSTWVTTMITTAKKAVTVVLVAMVAGESVLMAERARVGQTVTATTLSAVAVED